MHLYWHQRDLRVPDNRGLHAATDGDTVVPVYVFDDTVLSQVGRPKRAFLAAGVRALRAAYRERGSDLLVREGDAESVLPALADEFDADTVFHAAHYDAARRNRRTRVADALAAAGVDTAGHVDHTLVDPATLDDAYPSHSQFYDDWQQAPKPDPVPAPDADALADVHDDHTLSVPAPEPPLPDAGHAAATDRLAAFLDDGIASYNDTRDDLAAAVDAPTSAVSRLSPYLAAGNIGVREVWAAVADAYDDATGDAARNIGKYRYELSWREQNYHLLYHTPRLQTENYVSFDAPIAWQNSDDHFEAWTRGETGYPLVDAGMRQLRAEGYVHNRPRQVVASFLTKHLLVDWRRGERHFADRLVDYDPANNAANWQWTASTGTDTVAVRIFDPVSQMAKYDSDAAFVTEYVPELRGVDPETIVDWPTLRHSQRERLAPDYHHPIVDRDHAYERAQRVFEAALDGDA
ncbi:MULTISPECIES: deoxyribodipyrimidine photo-lyase [Halobacterium]|uniref:cryptochrome/photolyase family protein n=1 Tax=Halobacterium TaxID=2239 RepID=UPI0019626CF4|nr:MULTISPECIES: deoxyribodipyrimidine photo-lyase [Halobacterium]MCF2164792.1 DNA photolyase family protein [Halobacterium salinarum]MCF2168583.1 DNA photolyase family protein [Halobacterium salinarum]MCF2239238.1 DNA photolyase family protein [Halobacterium salinarum]QRY22040.1 deoxyribodipyrimidine photo-lyase [Halobacterium sp. GSL-19]QRY24125.1 DNA photolyase family protein [Halobacterium sp. BOL4-2]